MLGRELTPLEMLLTECGQGTDTTALPTIDELLGRHVDLDKVRLLRLAQHVPGRRSTTAVCVHQEWGGHAE